MLDCQKKHFALPEGLHYLNCAYMAPMATAVEEAGIAGIRRKRDPSRVSPDDFFTDGEAVRETFARLVGIADASRVALVPSVSYGIASAARNLEVPRGSNLVVLHEQFPSNVYTWHRLAAGSGAEMRVVSPPPRGAGRGAEWNRRILEAIDRQTALVAVPHVHWADGTLFDLVAIGARARDVGAALIVDGTQSVGALPFDFDAIRPDALVCAGYKWLLGPYSLGVSYFGERFDNGIPIEENWISRRDSRNFAGLVEYRSEYADGAARFDVGERSNFILVPMLLAALRLLEDWTVSRVQEYCRFLSLPVLGRAREIGYGIEDEGYRSGHLFGIRTPPGVSAEDLKRRLERRHISVSVRGDAVRVAPNVYNDQGDMMALQAALEEALTGDS